MKIRFYRNNDVELYRKTQTRVRGVSKHLLHSSAFKKLGISGSKTNSMYAKSLGSFDIKCSFSFNLVSSEKLYKR